MDGEIRFILFSIFRPGRATDNTLSKTLVALLYEPFRLSLLIFIPLSLYEYK
jgi:hypothetical protein